ncbi:sulfotransferase family 2 domain-containing protein [Candidatus Venteria ishoeyi]|uniref:sulfotransferase family 2 domain-containing protein n=1 Tax=Candidatus Venteria ishoeyi TaxID=1899563 RepID=UPI0025A5B2A7|nr:sulfotransferase family 2 domain-containing protein [Candidatus Venteria ishoeyi]MDM8548378.1 sulfotransferase family 2 domain-containing protein [Candidatus Venteria ishoeyi]
MLISVHIPKTGGSSFRSLLRQVFKEKLLLDYADAPMQQGNFSRNMKAVLALPGGRGIERQYDCVHGHFLPLKYRWVRNQSLITWLRDPAERVASRYFYWKRKFNPEATQFRKYIKDADISLEAFCKIPHYQNLYAKYLWMMNIKQFDFIGITENYDNSLQIFKKMYDINAAVSVTADNTNPDKSSKQAYVMDENLRHLIYQNNQQDYDIYQRGVEINQRLQAQWLG